MASREHSHRRPRTLLCDCFLAPRHKRLQARHEQRQRAHKAPGLKASRALQGRGVHDSRLSSPVWKTTAPGAPFATTACAQDRQTTGAFQGRAAHESCLQSPIQQFAAAGLYSSKWPPRAATQSRHLRFMLRTKRRKYAAGMRVAVRRRRARYCERVSFRVPANRFSCARIRLPTSAQNPKSNGFRSGERRGNCMGEMRSAYQNKPGSTEFSSKDLAHFGSIRPLRTQFGNALRFQAPHGAQTVPRQCPDGAQNGTRHGAQWQNMRKAAIDRIRKKTCSKTLSSYVVPNLCFHTLYHWAPFWAPFWAPSGHRLGTVWAPCPAWKRSTFLNCSRRIL